MSEVKHTPTPWELGWAKGLTGPNMSTMATFDFEGRKVVPIAGTNKIFIAAVPQLQEANAEFIVRACNSHEELVEALKTALPFLERFEQIVIQKFGTNSEFLHKAIDEVKAALAKAGRP